MADIGGRHRQHVAGGRTQRAPAMSRRDTVACRALARLPAPRRICPWSAWPDSALAGSAPLAAVQVHRRSEEAGLPQPTRKDFEKLLAFRVSLRRFQRWSEDQASAVGLTHVQHQLLVAIKGHPGDDPPAIGDLAGYLLLRHHSAVELVDRAEVAGFVRRRPDAKDARVVRVELTHKGDHLVTELTEAHLTELRNLAAALSDLISG